MAPNDDSARTGQETGEPGNRRRRAARYALPVAVAGVAAATIGLVPALAASGDPDLPQITAQELIEKIAASDTQQLSGSVKISTDLGLPGIADVAGSFLGGAGHGGGGAGKDGGGSSAAPDAKLAQLATGKHTLRVAIDGPERQKVSIVEKTSEYSLIRNGDEVWAYDSASNEVFHHKGTGTGGGKAGSGKAGGAAKHSTAPKELPTPKTLAAEVLKAAEKSTSVTVDGTVRVAGRSAYQLVVEPKGSGSTIGSVKIAVDSKTGTPLKFTVVPFSGGKAAVDVGFTKVDFGKPAASNFAFTPPKGATVKDAEDLRKEAEKAGAAAEKKADGKGRNGGFGPGSGFGGLGDLGGLGESGDTKVIGEGWNAVARIGTPAAAGATGSGGGALPPEADKLLGSFSDSVSGKFGSGTVFKTRLVNALMTDDGTVYVGAVTKDALVKAANADR